MNKHEIVATCLFNSLNANDNISSGTSTPTSISTSKSRSSSLTPSTDINIESYSMNDRIKLINKIVMEMEQGVEGKNHNESTENALLKQCCEALSEELLENVEDLAIMKVEMDAENDVEHQRQFRKRLRFLFQLNNDLKRLNKKVN